MVIFNDLRITSDGGYLIIDAEVLPYPYLSNVYIDTVDIYTEESSYDANGFTGEPVFSRDYSEEVTKGFSLNLRGSDLTNTKVIDLSEHIFYVRVSTFVEGTPSTSIPCEMDNKYSVGFTLNWYPIYQMGIEHMKKTADNCCEISTSFVDYMLRLKALQLALNTSQFQYANDKFKEWFLNREDSYVAPCNCR